MRVRENHLRPGALDFCFARPVHKDLWRAAPARRAPGPARSTRVASRRRAARAPAGAAPCAARLCTAIIQVAASSRRGGRGLDGGASRPRTRISRARRTRDPTRISSDSTHPDASAGGDAFAPDERRHQLAEAATEGQRKEQERAATTGTLRRKKDFRNRDGCNLRPLRNDLLAAVRRPVRCGGGARAARKATVNGVLRRVRLDFPRALRDGNPGRAGGGWFGSNTFVTRSTRRAHARNVATTSRRSGRGRAVSVGGGGDRRSSALHPICDFRRPPTAPR